MEDVAVVTKGWFKVPGVRPDGDRTLKEQMMGLERALAECKGKTVLDLGCAEGLISLEFAKAGAKSVVGIELLSAHLAVARTVCRKYVAQGVIRFVCGHLGDIIVATCREDFSADIVLALGIIHKLDDPNVPMAFAADCAKELLCFRAPAKVTPEGADYLVKSKFKDNVCNVPKLMREKGFADEGTVPGVRGEGVQYWRRKK